MPSAPKRHDAAVFYGTVAVMWGFFCLICHWSSVLLDDWYQVAYWQRHPFTLGSIWHNAVYNYLHYNPRLGENFLLLVNGPRWIYLLLTPTVEVGLLFIMFAVTWARWPRPTRSDAGRLFVLLIVLWMVAPVPGIMWFYRPYNTNYVYGIAITLLLFVPYQLELARPELTYRNRYLAPALLVSGLAAGLTNEHSGPTAILALFLLVYLIWRKHRQLRAWMWTGLIGLCVGYPALFFAPGQSERYGGLATRMGPISVIVDRGTSGTLDVVRGFVWEGQLALYILVGAVLLAYRGRKGATPPRLDRRQAVTIAVMIVSALLMVMTLFFSPSWGERLFFAPAVMFAAAMVLLLDVLGSVRAVRRYVLWFCAGIAAYHAIRLVTIYPREYDDNAERIATMAATKPGDVAIIKPYHYGRSPWMNSDDFGYASLREYVAHEVFGIAGIEYDRPIRAEPTPPYHMELEYTFDPPMPKAEVERHLHMPLSYIPSYVDRNVQLIRRIVPQLRAIPGHRLVSVTSHVVGLDLPGLGGRPLLGCRWHDDKFDAIDVRRYFDDQGMLYWLNWSKSIPEGVVDTYLASCGQVERRPLTPDPRGRGLRMTFEYTCRGLYLEILCTKQECWLATTAFR